MNQRRWAVSHTRVGGRCTAPARTIAPNGGVECVECRVHFRPVAARRYVVALRAGAAAHRLSSSSRSGSSRTATVTTTTWQQQPRRPRHQQRLPGLLCQARGRCPGREASPDTHAWLPTHPPAQLPADGVRCQADAAPLLLGSAATRRAAERRRRARGGDHLQQRLPAQLRVQRRRPTVGPLPPGCTSCPPPFSPLPPAALARAAAAPRAPPPPPLPPLQVPVPALCLPGVARARRRVFTLREGTHDEGRRPSKPGRGQSRALRRNKRGK